MIKTQFKIGDKVTCESDLRQPAGFISAGTTHEVTHVFGTGRIKLRGVQGLWSASKFKLSKKKQRGVIVKSVALIVASMALASCATPSPIEVRRLDVRACAKDLKQSEFQDETQMYNFCLKVHGFERATPPSIGAAAAKP